MKNVKSKATLGLICVIILISLVAAWQEQLTKNEGIRIHVIDVGQADCMVVETPDGNVLIDTGTDFSERDLRGYLRSHGLTRFAYMILSHPHDDHIGNADMILREFTVEHMISADTTSQELVWKNTLQAINEVSVEKGTDWIKPVSGAVYYVGKLRLELLMVPEAENEGGNDDSMIVRLDYGDCSMLLTGDAVAESEERLLGMVPEEKLRVDLLKVAHHGSSGSSSESFLQRVSPRIAVISCGNGNPFSHPHEELLNRLRSINADIYRTDLNGTLRFFCDGSTFSLESVRS